MADSDLADSSFVGEQFLSLMKTFLNNSENSESSPIQDSEKLVSPKILKHTAENIGNSSEKIEYAQPASMQIFDDKSLLNMLNNNDDVTSFRYAKSPDLKISPDRRPFQCHICGKSFTRKYHAIRHEREVHDKLGRMRIKNGDIGCSLVLKSSDTENIEKLK